MNITDNTLIEVKGFTTIDTFDSVDKFDGILISPVPDNDNINRRALFSVTLINFKTRVKYTLHDDYDLGYKLPLQILRFGIYSGKYGTSITIMQLESTVHHSIITKCFNNILQTKIH